MLPHWIIDVVVEAAVTLPSGDVLERDAFYAWLWEAAAGLVGIDEGSVSVDEAAARGLADSLLVIDSAAAPAHRDWVAGLGVVRPAWDEGHAGATAAGTTIFIEPGAGFGTGLHETTQLCLAALHGWRSRLERVLDFGSGSGILGIAAAVGGARHVDAVEVDTLVHEAIRANALRNGVADRVCVGATLPAEPGPYDLVLANIVAPVLLEHADRLCGRLTSAGGCVLSGLRAEDVEAVANRYAALLGCRPLVTDRGEWRCLTFCRRARPAQASAI